MNPRRWARVKELYCDAVEQPVDARLAFVIRQAGDDDDLRRAVLELLEVDDAAAETHFRPILADALAGTVLGGHRLRGQLGAGGMGVVYLAEPEGGGAPVAVKILTKIASIRPRAVEMFRREAAAVARLGHPGIVPLLSFGFERGHWYQVMEYVPGPSLRLLLERARGGQFDAGVDLRDPIRCAGIIAAVLEALQHAHEHGIIHRDIKPDNLLLDPQGQPRIVDFGIARDLALEGVTRTGEISGTPYYMSPEQANTVRRAIDHRSDLFSTAAVLYEMLTLRRPFEGEDCREILERIVGSEPKAIRRIAPGVPHGIANVCHQALTKDPHYRFPSAIVFASLLRSAMRGEPVAVRREPWRIRTARAIGRHPRLAIVGVCVAIATAMLAAQGVAHASARQARIQVGLGATPARIEVVGLGAPGSAPQSLYRADARTGNIVVPVTTARLRVRIERGTEWHELYRECDPGETVAIPEPRAPQGEAAAGMVFIEGGPVRYAATEGRDGTMSDGVVEGFWIDAAVATNRALVDFLRATGRNEVLASPRFDVERGLEARPDWWDLPATGVSWDIARAFAEWHGKRLPTLAEWHRAVENDERWRAAAVDASALGRAFNLGPVHSNASLATYLGAVRPALEPGQTLSHPVGNVWVWVEEPMFERVGDGWVSRRDTRLATGHAWTSGVEIVAKERLEHRTYVPAIYGPIDIGIRCVRSRRP